MWPIHAGFVLGFHLPVTGDGYFLGLGFKTDQDHAVIIVIVEFKFLFSTLELDIPVDDLLPRVVFGRDSELLQRVIDSVVVSVAGVMGDLNEHGCGEFYLIRRDSAALIRMPFFVSCTLFIESKIFLYLPAQVRVFRNKFFQKLV